jgi:hypothetical protein
MWVAETLKADELMKFTGRRSPGPALRTAGTKSTGRVLDNILDWCDPPAPEPPPPPLPLATRGGGDGDVLLRPQEGRWRRGGG